MANQQLTLNEALQQGHVCLGMGNMKVAGRIFQQIIDQFPDLHAARDGLRTIFKKNTSQVVEPGIEMAINEVYQSDYFKQGAIQGWAYSMIVDHPYINADLAKIADQSSSQIISDDSSNTPLEFDPKTLSPGHSPHLYFKLIDEIKDIRERFTFLSQLAEEQSLSILADSFVDTSDADLETEICSVFDNEAINVVILGAGISGLALANMLKNTFHDKINILVVENRVQTTHFKKNYCRNWLTNVPLSLMQGVMANNLTELLSTLGANGLTGTPINILETLMLLSCKELGVKFLFEESPNLAFIKQATINVVFDATGNRFNSASLEHIPEQTIQQTATESPFSKHMATGYSKYGVLKEPCQDIDKIELLTAKNLIVPSYQEQPIKTAMIKITGIPIAIVEPLLHTIQHYNYDNRFYLWSGSLKDEINQALLIVNLTLQEYEVLHSYLSASLSLEIFMEHFSDWQVLDKRFIEIIRKLTQEPSSDYQIQIEPPFLYEPYMLAYKQNGERLMGVPLVRIGDSIYNGHVKCGNGMTYHLFHLRYIHDAFLKSQTLYQ